MDDSTFEKMMDRFHAQFCDATWDRWWRGAHFEAGPPPTIYVEPSRLSLLRSHFMARARSIFGADVLMEPLPDDGQLYAINDEGEPSNHRCP